MPIHLKPFDFGQMLRRLKFLPRPAYFNNEDFNKELEIIHSGMEDISATTGAYTSLVLNIGAVTESELNPTTYQRQFSWSHGNATVFFRGQRFVLTSDSGTYTTTYTKPNTGVNPKQVRPATYFCLVSELTLRDFSDDPALCGLTADELPTSVQSVDVEQYLNTRIEITENPDALAHKICILATVYPRYDSAGVVKYYKFKNSFNTGTLTYNNLGGYDKTVMKSNKSLVELLFQRVDIALGNLLNERQLVRRHNLADLENGTKARKNIGFDKLVNHAQLVKAENLKDLPSPENARFHLGLGNAASHNYGTDATSVLRGDALPVGVILMWSGGAGSIPANWKLCLREDSKLTLADGSTKTIGEIVNERLEVQVVSYNEETGQMEKKLVVDWFKIPVENKEVWYNVQMASKSSRHGTKSVWATNNHPFYTRDGWVEAQNLVAGQEVLTYTKGYTELAKQALMGMYFGDGSISMDYSMKHGQGEVHEGYTEFVEKFFGVLSATRVNGSGYGKGKICNTTSLSLGFLSNDVRPLFTAKRTVTLAKLRELGACGLAFWYMDDGNLQTDKRTGGQQVQLHTEGFSHEEVDLICEYFRAAYGYEARSYKRGNTDGKIVRLSVKDSKHFLAIVAPYIEPSMRYKLPEEYKDTPFVLEGLSAYCEVKKWETVVTKSRSEYHPSKQYDKKFDYRYDITVEDNHSFIANGFVVHNCDGTNGTPNLKSRFIVGYDPDDPEYDAVGKTGGVKNRTLTGANIPQHTHTFAGTTESAGEHSHTIKAGNGTSGGGADKGEHDDDSSYINPAGIHTHEFSGTTGTYGQVNPTPIDIRPPYYVLCFIMFTGYDTPTPALTDPAQASLTYPGFSTPDTLIAQPEYLYDVAVEELDNLDVS